MDGSAGHGREVGRGKRLCEAEMCTVCLSYHHDNLLDFAGLDELCDTFNVPARERLWTDILFDHGGLCLCRMVELGIQAAVVQRRELKAVGAVIAIDVISNAHSGSLAHLDPLAKLPSPLR